MRLKFRENYAGITAFNTPRAINTWVVIYSLINAIKHVPLPVYFNYALKLSAKWYRNIKNVAVYVSYLSRRHSLSKFTFSQNQISNEK